MKLVVIILIGVILGLSVFLSIVLLQNQHLESEYDRINSQYMDILKSKAYCIAQEVFGVKQTKCAIRF